MTNIIFSGNSSSSRASARMLSEEDARAELRGSAAEATEISVRWQQSRKRVSMVQQLFYGLLVILISLTESSSGLRDVRITVPSAVKKGDNANLICNYDMEGDTLYTVKYYKGRREFYRYTPKENPAIKVFPHSGIRIEENMSNGSNIVLLALDTPLSGKYSCEVSADAPSFHTTIVYAEMEVVEPPEERPSITGIQSRYRIGDIIKGECSSLHSRPAANLTWTINDIPVPQSTVLDYKVTKNANGTESSSLAVFHMVTHLTFARGKVKLRCYATIYNVYKSSSDKIVEEVIPRILATGHNGAAANLLQNTPFDESSNGLLPDHQMDENGMLVQRDHDPHLQQQYNDLTSATSSAAPLSSSFLFSSSSSFSALLVGKYGAEAGKGSCSSGVLAAVATLPVMVVLLQQLLLKHCHRMRHIVRAIISEYLIIVVVSLIIIREIVTRFRC